MKKIYRLINKTKMDQLVNNKIKKKNKINLIMMKLMIKFNKINNKKKIKFKMNMIINNKMHPKLNKKLMK